jgi:DNA modification methylase
MSVQIIEGDCRSVLKTLPAQSIHTCVTSPPYFGLRDYGVDGQIGLEETPAAFVAELVAVFREVRRVLRDDGTLWLNLGDSYCNTDKWGGGGNVGKNTVAEDGTVPSWESTRRKRPQMPGLKPKDLIGIPWRVAFALQADGWYLRQDIIWHKPNSMPESVRDRCTKAHEYIFLLSKSERYHFDAEAIAEVSVKGADGSAFNKGKTAEHQLGRAGAAERAEDGKRNRRSVWTVSTQPFSGAHFATFPPDLIEPCIKAGSPAGGSVLDPFGGAGTAALVADRLGRHAVSIELNPDYAAMQRQRIALDAGLLADFNDLVMT